MELEVLRFQLRLAKDLAALPLSSHGHAARLVEQVGAQVGGGPRSRNESAADWTLPWVMNSDRRLRCPPPKAEAAAVPTFSRPRS